MVVVVVVLINQSINQSINLFVNLSLSQSNETVSKIHDRTPRKIQIFTYRCPPPIINCNNINLAEHSV